MCYVCALYLTFYVAQFTAGQLAEVYATEKAEHWFSSIFTSRTQTAPSRTPLSRSAGATMKKENIGALPPMPAGMYPSSVPTLFLQLALPRLAQEVTRPFLNKHVSTSRNGKIVPRPDDEMIFRLRRLLWIRNVELEKAYLADNLVELAPVSLMEIERRLYQQDKRYSIRARDMDCPPSPTARLPSSIAEQLTWSPTRDKTPPSKPQKPRKRPSRNNKDGIPNNKVSPPPVRTVSDTSLSSSARGVSVLSPQGEDSPSLTTTLMNKEYDLQEIYMSPFRQFFRKTISRQRATGKNINHIEDLDQEIDLKYVLDSCVKVCISREVCKGMMN